MEPVKEFDYKGYHIEIHYDDTASSPREDDNLGRILYVYPGHRYNLGDTKATVDEMNEIMEDPDAIALPVYAYIHSGIMLDTKPFSCPWDSGQSGIIYTWVKKALKMYQKKRMTPALRKRVKESLRQEVKTFGEYLNGEVYGYIIHDEDGEEVDSLWGIMPFEYAEQAAKEAVRAMSK